MGTPFASLTPAQQTLLFSQAQQMGMTPLAYLDQIQSSGTPVSQALQSASQSPSAQSVANASYVSNETSQYDANVGKTPAANGTAGNIQNILQSDFLGYSTTGSNYNTDPSQYAGAGANRTTNASSNAVGNAMYAPGAINAIDASSQSGPEALGELTGNDNAADDTFDKIMGGLADAVVVAGGGYLLAPAFAAAATGAGLTGTAAGVAAGAATGATVGAGNAALTGSSVGKSALTGAVTGGLGAAAAPVTSYLGGQISDATGAGSGLSNTLASGIVKGAIGAGTSALSGGSAETGAVTGAAGGLLSGGAQQLGLSSSLSNSIGKVGAGLIGSSLSGGNANSSGAAPQTSSIGNIGNMAATSSTDSLLSSTLGGALPGLVSGAASIYGTQNAAEAVTNADTNAINTQNTALGNINNVWSTQQGLGQGADTALGSALGTNGQPANYSGFENMPGYQFAVNQGTQAIQRQAASMGSAYTPNTAAAVGQYVTGTAASDYNTYISQLMGAAGLGSTANTGLQTANQTNANNVSTLQQNQGYAQAYGVQGASNTVAGLFGATGAGTGLLNGVLGGSSNMNSSGVPQGNGTAASNASDPFAGTTLANNQNAINAYDQSNGPTSSDISGLTGSNTYNQGVNAPIQPFDTSSIDTPSYLDLSGY